MKNIFFLFIAISFYRNIVCQNIVCELDLIEADCKSTKFQGTLTSHSVAIVDLLFAVLLFTRCQFHQHFRCNFFVRKCLAQLFYSYVLAL